MKVTKCANGRELQLRVELRESDYITKFHLCELISKCEYLVQLCEVSESVNFAKQGCDELRVKLGTVHSLTAFRIKWRNMENHAKYNRMCLFTLLHASYSHLSVKSCIEEVISPEPRKSETFAKMS